MKLPSTLALLEVVKYQPVASDGGKSTIGQTLEMPPLYSKKGGYNQGTYATFDLCLAYVEYLSPKLHAKILETYRRYLEGDVTLAAEVSDRASVADNAWLADRTMAKIGHVALGEALLKHGVTYFGRGRIINTEYAALFGTNAAGLRERYDVKNPRDAMDRGDLALIGLTEDTTRRIIEDRNCNGERDCKYVMMDVANQYADLRNRLLSDKV